MKGDVFYKDPITGKQIKQICPPFNRKRMNPIEMDEYFAGLE